MQTYHPWDQSQTAAGNIKALLHASTCMHPSSPLLLSLTPIRLFRLVLLLVLPSPIRLVFIILTRALPADLFITAECAGGAGAAAATGI